MITESQYISTQGTIIMQMAALLAQAERLDDKIEEWRSEQEWRSTSDMPFASNAQITTEIQRLTNARAVTLATYTEVKRQMIEADIAYYESGTPVKDSLPGLLHKFSSNVLKN